MLLTAAGLIGVSENGRHVYNFFIVLILTIIIYHNKLAL